MPRLTFIQPRFAAASCELREGSTRVGRSSASDLVIRDESISADHCEILVSWNEVIVREHGSRNGTWVAGRQVTAQLPVNHGDVIRFGRVEARLELAEPDLDETSDSMTRIFRKQVDRGQPGEVPSHVEVGDEGAPDGSTVRIAAPLAESRRREQQDTPGSWGNLEPIPRTGGRLRTFVWLLVGMMLAGGAVYLMGRGR